MGSGLRSHGIRAEVTGRVVTVGICVRDRDRDGIRAEVTVRVRVRFRIMARADGHTPSLAQIWTSASAR